jgi:hypothetical protein
MLQLEQSGVCIDAREQTVVETVRQDFENLSASIENQPGFESEAPKLAAWMVSYAIERDRMGLTEYETFPDEF